MPLLMQITSTVVWAEKNETRQKAAVGEIISFEYKGQSIEAEFIKKWEWVETFPEGCTLNLCHPLKQAS